LWFTLREAEGGLAIVEVVPRLMVGATAVVGFDAVTAAAVNRGSSLFGRCPSLLVMAWCFFRCSKYSVKDLPLFSRNGRLWFRLRPLAVLARTRTF
jgi:hypothetical protein